MSKHLAENTKNNGARPHARTAMFVLLAFVINLFSVSATLAGTPLSMSGAPLLQGNSQKQSQKINIKPCHHNRGLLAIHNRKLRSDAILSTDPGDDLCCTNDDRSGEFLVTLRSSRDREWLTATSPPNKVPSLDFASVGYATTRHIAPVTLHIAQLSGLIGAQAQFIRTVRLQT